MLHQLVATESKRAQIAMSLREAIEEGLLRPGDQIVESRVAKELGVSQSPVREALATLAEEGLVTKIQHRGTFVAEISRHELYESTLVRAVLEGLCARLITERADPADLDVLDPVLADMRAAVADEDDARLAELDVRFHQITYDLAHHDLLRESLLGMQRRLRLSLQVAETSSPARRNARYESHPPLLEALRSGDGDRAEAVAREHVVQSSRLLAPG